MNIKLTYLYRDAGNNKQMEEIIFSNTNSLSLQNVEKIIKARLIEDQWFFADIWRVPDVHFANWSRQLDHDYHEYCSLEETTDGSTHEDIEAFRSRIQ